MPMSTWPIIILIVWRRPTAAVHGLRSPDTVVAGVSRRGTAVAVFVARCTGWIGAGDLLDGVVGWTHSAVGGFGVVVVVI